MSKSGTKDQHSAERVVYYKEGMKIEREYEAHTFEMTALLAMVVSVVGVAMNWKMASWISLMLSFRNISNYRPGVQIRQIFSGIFLCSASVMMVYVRDPAPVFYADDASGRTEF